MKKHLSLTIDCSKTPTPSLVHTHIAHVLHFPSHYGANTDALRDCLTDVLVEHSLRIVWKDTAASKKNAALVSLKNEIEKIVGIQFITCLSL